MECRICNKEKDLRIGVCFDCVEAESIIVNGLDMYENGLRDTTPASTGLDKLRFLIKKGWTKQ